MNDAVTMSNIALARGFTEVKLLLGPEATFQRVVAEIERAAVGVGRLVAGDIFLFTFAGHGSRVPDSERLLSEEPDRKDEAIVLYDRLLLDDYLQRVLWPKFDKGVRIVGVADSCHSGSALFAMMDTDEFSGSITDHLAFSALGEAGSITAFTSVHMTEMHSLISANMATETLPPTVAEEPLPEEEPVVAIGGNRLRELSVGQGRAHRVANKSFYDNLKIPSLKDASPIQASLITMGACQDDATTMDGDSDGNGFFTRALLEVWNNGAFAGDYVTFRDEIEQKIAVSSPGQQPVLKPEVLPAFSSQSPFSI
jgi:hypothetical protein